MKLFTKRRVNVKYNISLSQFGLSMNHCASTAASFACIHSHIFDSSPEILKLPLLLLLFLSVSCPALFNAGLRMKSALGGGATLVGVVTVILTGDGIEKPWPESALDTLDNLTDSELVILGRPRPESTLGKGFC